MLLGGARGLLLGALCSSKLLGTHPGIDRGQHGRYLPPHDKVQRGWVVEQPGTRSIPCCICITEFADSIKSLYDSLYARVSGVSGAQIQLPDQLPQVILLGLDFKPMVVLSIKRPGSCHLALRSICLSSSRLALWGSHQSLQVRVMHLQQHRDGLCRVPLWTLLRRARHRPSPRLATGKHLFDAGHFADFNGPIW